MMESYILKIYKNPKKEIEKLNIENLNYLREYFKTEFICQKKNLNQSSLICIKDRKMISIIYKSMNLEMKRRILRIWNFIYYINSIYLRSILSIKYNFYIVILTKLFWLILFIYFAILN